MTLHHVRFVSAALSLVLFAACVSTRAAGPSTREWVGGLTPRGDARYPQRLEDSRPTLRPVKTPTDPSKGVVDLITVAVQVDPDGRPDLKTVRVVGRGAIENRGEIVSWLSRLTLAPARNEAGTPVRAEYRMSFRLPPA